MTCSRLKCYYVPRIERINCEKSSTRLHAATRCIEGSCTYARCSALMLAYIHILLHQACKNYLLYYAFTFERVVIILLSSP